MEGLRGRNRRLNLGIIVPLTAIGIVIILVSFLIEDSQEKPNSVITSEGSSSHQTEASSSDDHEDSNNSVEATQSQIDIEIDDNFIESLDSETESRDNHQLANNQDLEESSRLAETTEVTKVRSNQPKLVEEDGQTETKKPVQLTIQLIQNFSQVLVKTNLEADKEYYVSFNLPACSHTLKSATWINIDNDTIDNLSHKSWVCVRAKIKSQTSYQYRAIQVDLSKPTINLIPKLSKVVVDVQPNNSFNTDWFQSGKKPKCNDQTKDGWQDLDGNQIDNLKDKHWICVRSQIKSNTVFGYQSIQINLNKKPEIKLQQKKTDVVVNLSPKPIYNASWFRSKVAPVCSQKTTAVIWKKLDQTTIKGLKDKEWICVRAAQMSYSYKSIQVDLAKPTVNLTQTNNTVLFKFSSELLAKDPEIAKRSKWSKVSKASDCKTSITSWEKLEGDKIANLATGQYHICVYLVNKFEIENLQTLEVNISQSTTTPSNPTNPTLSIGAIQYDNRLHLIFSGSASNKEYKLSSNPNCSTLTNFGLLPSDNVIKNLTVGDWVCVKAIFYGRTYSFKKEVLQPPQISTTQTLNNINVVFPANSTDKKYLTAAPTNSNPSCMHPINNSLWVSITPTGTQINTSNKPNGQWYCFYAKGANGVYGYKREKLSKRPPTPTIQQSNNKFYVAPANGETCTASDSDGVDQCQYFKTNTNPDCSDNIANDDSRWVDFSAGVIQAETFDDGDYICVKVANNGLATYAEKQAVIAVTITLVEQVYNRFELSISDTSKVYLATSKYFKSESEPNCDYSTQHLHNLNFFGSRTLYIQDSHWVCAKIQNKNNSWSFVKKQRS